MTRKTSIDVYNAIRTEGLLGRMQLEVYELLFEHGPMTQGEVSLALKVDRNVASPRFAELDEMGAIEAVEKRPCRVTGRVCLGWDVTDQNPTERASKPKDEALREIVMHLREQVTTLDAEVKQLKAAQFDSAGQGALFLMRGH